MEEGIPFRPQGYNKCDQALEVLKMCDDISPTDYKLIRSMLDSSDEENLVMAEVVLWDKYKHIIIKIKES